MAAKQNSKPVLKTGNNNNAVRAQILATEHWSLLAARSMTWSEVMSRITIHLSFASASLVVLALVAQVSGFGAPFHIMAIGLTTAVFVLGTLTGVRVNNASIDDAFMLQGMNRLRAGYNDIDPGVKRYFVTGYNDDQTGVMLSYLMGAKRSLPSHIFGSTNMYMCIVNALTAGALGALITSTAGGNTVATVLIGFLSGIICLLCWLEIGRRSFKDGKFTSNFPTNLNK